MTPTKNVGNSVSTAASRGDPSRNKQTRKRPASALNAGAEGSSPSQRIIPSTVYNEDKMNEGYDTDGEIGPFFDTVENEGEQLFEELPAPGTRRVGGDVGGEGTGGGGVGGSAGGGSAATTTGAAAGIATKSVAWIRNELKLRNQSITGRKDVLVERLKAAIDKKVTKYKTLEDAKRNSNPTGKVDGMKSFATTAYWEPLEPETVQVQEPANPTFKLARAPTVSEKEEKYVPQKYNFPQRFEVPSFEAVKKEFEFDRRGNIKKGSQGNAIEIVSRRDNGCVNASFKAKYKLFASSKPWEVVNCFIPFESSGKKKGDISFSFDKLCEWTNCKATMAGAGSNVYKGEWKPFTATELRQHFGLYLLQGLSPSPRVEYKFNPQRRDRIAGNDFVYKSFNANAQRRHKHFKAFLACCNPLINPPSRDQYPKWKVRPLIKWMNHRCPQVWDLGKSVAVDEMTMRFKGNHCDKLQITYKAEGDGFQADALCDNVYCYQVYMRNNSAPVKYLCQGLSPLHSRVMTLFDSLKDKHHHVGMDNLYNSAAFCKAAFNHEMKVLFHGVARKNGRGIPDCVFQEEQVCPAAQRAV